MIQKAEFLMITLFHMLTASQSAVQKRVKGYFNWVSYILIGKGIAQEEGGLCEGGWERPTHVCSLLNQHRQIISRLQTA